MEAMEAMEAMEDMAAGGVARRKNPQAKTANHVLRNKGRIINIDHWMPVFIKKDATKC
jgi:hypothetical protein